MSARDKFLSATRSGDWATIDDLINQLDQHDYWDTDFYTKVLDQAKKAHARRMIKQVKDAEGWPVFASVKTQDADGTTVRVYKQESLFDPDDYFQVVNYHHGVAQHHLTMAHGYAVRANTRYGMQLPMLEEEMSRA